MAAHEKDLTIDKDNAVQASDENKKSHVQMLCGALAAYHCSRSYYSGLSRLLYLMQDTFIKAFIPNLDGYIKQRFDVDLNQPDQIFEKVSDNFMVWGQEGFGSGFTYELARSDKHHYYVSVVSCFFHELFIHNNAPEESPILCAMDRVWAGRINGR